MTTIANTPYVLNDALLKIASDNYENAISKVEFKPTSQVLTWAGIVPAAAFTGVTTPTWVCTIGYAQDWETANSLSQYLLTNMLQTKTVVFHPRGSATGKPLFTADLIIMPGPIGGPGNTVQVGEVALGCMGKPVRTVVP